MARNHDDHNSSGGVVNIRTADFDAFPAPDPGGAADHAEDGPGEYIGHYQLDFERDRARLLDLLDDGPVTLTRCDFGTPSCVIAHRPDA